MINTFSENHWYFGMYAGAIFSANGDTHIPSIFSKPPLTSEPVYHSGAAGGLNIGYQLPNAFRIESELNYQYLPMSKINNAIGEGTVTYVTHSHTNLFSLFINSYYDFYIVNCSRFHPYFGVGAGYVKVKNTIQPAPPIPVAPGLFFTKKDINYDTAGYQGILGAAYKLNNQTYINFNYKYFSTLNQNATGHTNLGPDGYKTRQKIKDHIISIGVQYYFLNS